MSGHNNTVKVDIVLLNEAGKEVKRITVDAPGHYNFSVELQPGKYTLKLPGEWVWDGWHWFSTFNPSECPGPNTQVRVVKETDLEIFRGSIRAKTTSDTPATPPLKLILLLVLGIIVMGDFPQLRETVFSLFHSSPIQIAWDGSPAPLEPAPLQIDSSAGGAGLSPNVNEQFQQFGWITGELVNIRASQSDESPIIDQLPYGTSVAIAPEIATSPWNGGSGTKTWYPVILMDGRRGYVFSRYVEVIP